MRISTFSFNQTAVNGIENDESALSNTQNEISTGKSVNTPADNPVAAVEIAQLTSVQTTNTQYTTNGKSASTSLDLEENALSTSTTTLQSIRDLLVQANDGSQNPSDLQAIATQVQSLESSLVSTANSTDASGNYLFSGYSVTTQPFTRGSSGAVQYNGDSGVTSVSIDSSTQVQLNDPGNSIYMDVPSGNGTFTTAASSANTGTGVIDTGTVTDSSSWVPGTYTIAFSDPTGSTDATNYTVTDANGNTVSTGTYDPTNGGDISFDGVEVGITGTPAAGDTFTVAPSSSQSVFDNLDSVVSSLNTATSGSASRAQLSSQLNTALQQVDQALDQISKASSSVGARINMVTSTATSITTQNTTLATQISNLGDLDYASATSKLSEQSVALQAAESSYAAIAQLSLFKYLS